MRNRKYDKRTASYSRDADIVLQLCIVSRLPIICEVGPPKASIHPSHWPTAAVDRVQHLVRSPPLVEVFVMIPADSSWEPLCRNLTAWLCVLRAAAGEAVPGDAGGRPGLLPKQQELRQRPAGAGPPVLQGQDDGGGWITTCAHTPRGAGVDW